MEVGNRTTLECHGGVLGLSATSGRLEHEVSTCMLNEKNLIGLYYDVFCFNNFAILSRFASHENAACCHRRSSVV